MTNSVKRKQEKSHPSNNRGKKPKVDVDGAPGKKTATKMPSPFPPKHHVDESGEVEDFSDNSTEEFEGFEDANEVAKTKESRAEQKRMAAERKQAKPLGDVIYKSKKIWEQMRRKDLSCEERKKKIQEHQDMIRGNIKELVFKHDASRVVQTALKYGSKSIRQEVANELKGTYVSLAQSSYGKYLVVKVMHYGTPETKKMVVDEFCGSVKKLIKHREASFVIQDCYAEFGTPEQKAALIREFYGVEFAVFGRGKNDPNASLKKILDGSPEKRAVIMKNIFDLLTVVVSKGAVFFSIIHRVMLEFISSINPGTAIATEFIELIKEHIAEIAFTKDGSQVVMRCLALGTAKDRKAMIKALKPVSDKLAAHEFGHLALLTLFDVVDDTVLVNKSIFSELQPHMLDLAVNNFGQIPLLYSFVGRRTKLLPPSSISLLKEMDLIREVTSKKDPELRHSELRDHLSSAVLQCITAHAAVLSQDSFGCQFIVQSLLGAKGDKVPALNAVAALASGNPNEEGHIATTASGGRMLKTLVAGGHYNNKAKKVDVVTPPVNFDRILYDQIDGKIKDWATGAGSFVVVGLLEVDHKDKGDYKPSLEKGLKRNINDIKSSAEKGNKGSKVILEKLS